MKNLLILFIFIIGCNATPTVNDQEFNIEYVQPFLQQAEEAGTFTYNMSLTVLYVDELIVDGTNLAGYADIESQTITFNIAHEYWNSPAKKILIYHELGHYYIGKGHIDINVSCDKPFSIMSLWSKEYAPIQYEYWVSGKWRELEDYYMREMFYGSSVWKEYPGHEDILSYELDYPCR